jgi:hypothetical protein
MVLDNTGRVVPAFSIAVVGRGGNQYNMNVMMPFNPDFFWRQTGRNLELDVRRSYLDKRFIWMEENDVLWETQGLHPEDRLGMAFVPFLEFCRVNNDVNGVALGDETKPRACIEAVIRDGIKQVLRIDILRQQNGQEFLSNGYDGEDVQARRRDCVIQHLRSTAISKARFEIAKNCRTNMGLMLRRSISQSINTHLPEFNEDDENVTNRQMYVAMYRGNHFNVFPIPGEGADVNARNYGPLHDQDPEFFGHVDQRGEAWIYTEAPAPVLPAVADGGGGGVVDGGGAPGDDGAPGAAVGYDDAVE